MVSNFLPRLSKDAIADAMSKTDNNEFYDLLAQPLHEELYKRQTFDFLDELSDGQQLLLAYDYLRMQVGQGGFIQFIENGYIGLMPSMIEQFYQLELDGMAAVLDDALKVYVLNRDLFVKVKSVQEFAGLYDELKEFEGIDARFMGLNEPTISAVLAYARANIHEFATVEE